MTGAKGTGAPTPDALADLRERLAEKVDLLNGMAERADSFEGFRLRGKAQGVALALSFLDETAAALVGVQSRADHTITDEMVRVAVSVYYGWALDQPGRSLALEARMRAALRAALGQGTDDQEADA